MTEPRNLDPAAPPAPLGDLPVSLDLPVLGVPTRFLASDDGLLAPVRDAFGAWAHLPQVQGLRASARVTVRLVRHDAPGDGPGADVRYRFPRPRLFEVTTPGSRGVADLDRGEVVAHVTDRLVADAAHFRYAFLSALTLATVTVHDRVPLHAAAVGRRGAALLLHGPSGVGKSTLALAAAERGLDLLSEDVVYAEIRRGPRIWGLPGPVHVGRESLGFFPGLRPGHAVVRASGRTKVAVDVPKGGPPPLFAARAGTCLLRRSQGPARLEPATRAEVRAVLGRADEPGFDLFRDVAADAAGVASRFGAWRLDVGSSPREAAGLLDDLLTLVEHAPPTGDDP